MTRGCQKKIIHIKETDSTLYEEAYFILRRGVGEGFNQPGKDQLMKEANRIIDESMSFAYPSGHKKKRGSFFAPFAIGATISGAVFGVIALFAVLL